MCPGENDEFATNLPNEPTELTPDVDSDHPGTTARTRRTFLKAAALGAAAAALVQRGPGGTLRFGAASALADNLSSLNCTANDVRIPGPAQILNEPCDCSGTFNAQVRFRVINNTGTTRYCVTVHFCPVILPNGGTFNPGDVIIGDVPEKSDAFYTVTIPNYPCGSGLLCFGARGPEEDGGFPKGAPCPTGQCCTTVSWDVNPGCPTRVLTSKCRHQQVCIQGRGITTLDCDPSDAAIDTDCDVECGTTTTVQLCTTSGASLGPFTFTLSATPPTTISPPSGIGNCRTYTVGPITQDTTLTGTVTDADGCARSDTTQLNVEPIAAPTLSRTGPNCDGSVTIAVTPCDPNLTYTFTEGGTTLGTGCSLTRTFAPGSHTVTVTASNSAGTCDAEESITFTVNQPVAVILSAPSAGCNGVVTLTATASGGSGGYSFVVSPAGANVSGSGATRTITLQPQLDGQCRTVTVTVTDSAGCSATSNAVSFSQCVSTSAQCPHPNA